MGEAKLAMAVDIRLPSDQASNRHCMHLALSAATSRDRAKTERANRSANQPLDTGHRRCLSLYPIHQLDGRCGNCRCKTGLVQSGTVLLIGVYQLVSRDAVSYWSLPQVICRWFSLCILKVYENGSNASLSLSARGAPLLIPHWPHDALLIVTDASDRHWGPMPASSQIVRVLHVCLRWVHCTTYQWSVAVTCTDGDIRHN